jgi:hypothetical protein
VGPLTQDGVVLGAVLCICIHVRRSLNTPSPSFSTHAAPTTTTKNNNCCCYYYYSATTTLHFVIVSDFALHEHSALQNTTASRCHSPTPFNARINLARFLIRVVPLQIPQERASLAYTLHPTHKHLLACIATCRYLTIHAVFILRWDPRFSLDPPNMAITSRAHDLDVLLAYALGFRIFEIALAALCWVLDAPMDTSDTCVCPLFARTYVCCWFFGFVCLLLLLLLISMPPRQSNPQAFHGHAPATICDSQSSLRLFTLCHQHWPAVVNMSFRRPC